MGNRVVWVDIPAIDLERAITFYSAVLGSTVTKEGGPGFTFGLLPHTGNEVAGVFTCPQKTIPRLRSGRWCTSTPKAV